MKKLLSFLIILPIAAVNAAPIEPYDGAGTYININVGYATLQNLPNGSFSFNTNAGYNFNRAFALEGGWTNLTSSQYSATAYDNFYNAAVKGTLPLSDVFSLFGRLGGGINTTNFSGTSNCLCSSQDNVNFAWLAGIGGSFVLSTPL